MSSTKQKKSSAAKGVAIFFIVFIILEILLLVGVSRVFKNKDVTPSIAGYSVYLMDSNSMGDSVPQDALVIAANGAPSRDGIKKAVIAEEVPGVGTSVFWLADVSTSSDLNGVVYTLFQEKAPEKLYRVKTSNVVGTASSYYLTAGKVIKFITSEFGRIACIAVPLFLFVLLELIIMLFNRARYDDDEEDDDEDEDEDDEPVELDDFLYGGENDKEMRAEAARAAEEELREEQFAPKQTPRRIREEAPEPEKEPEPITISEPEEAPAQEAAAEAAEEAEAAAEEAAPEAEKKDEADAGMKMNAPKKKVVRRRPSELKMSGEKRSASASMADLMKLMEEEQNKLKNQLGDK
ncbi:MAG: hypothetical protein IKO44_00410 [Ruminococcus sp.]|nr:hypothetical protein [Ruminococcus sp.]